MKLDRVIFVCAFSAVFCLKLQICVTTQTWGEIVWTHFDIMRNSTDFCSIQTGNMTKKVSENNRAQFHGSAYHRILRLRSRFPACVQAPNFCASLVSVECLVTLSTDGQKPKFVANLWNTLAISIEFPASVSADSMLMVSRAMKLGPVLTFRWRSRAFWALTNASSTLARVSASSNDTASPWSPTLLSVWGEGFGDGFSFGGQGWWRRGRRSLQTLSHRLWLVSMHWLTSATSCSTLVWVKKYK